MQPQCAVSFRSPKNLRHLEIAWNQGWSCVVIGREPLGFFGYRTDKVGTRWNWAVHQGIQQDDDYDVFNVSSFGVSTLCSCRFWWQMFYWRLTLKVHQQLRSVEFSFDFGNRPWVSWWSEALVETRSTRSLWNDPLTWGPCLFEGGVDFFQNVSLFFSALLCIDIVSLKPGEFQVTSDGQAAGWRSCQCIAEASPFYFNDWTILHWRNHFSCF